MPRTILRIALVVAAGAVAAASAAAHPGHGQDALVHGHASDAWGPALGLLAGALALWWARRK